MLTSPRVGDTHPFAIVDVFTDTPLEGNQLGVFTRAGAIADVQMQALALELGFSETVFVLGSREGVDARMRIFTPTHELPFAGHPVLGTAFVLGEELGSDEVALETGAGVVVVALRREGGRVSFGTMAQPLPTWRAYTRPHDLLDALGVAASGLPIEEYRNGPHHVYVELADASAVAALEPDMRLLARLQIGASCFAASGAKVKTRMFAPGLGVAEDRDPSGSRDRPPVGPVRERARLRRASRSHRGRRVGGRRRARRVPAAAGS
jgi:trans-2,3-dihydro-3-hydroxyanthranilate isomerase